jgi:hypothetical protein
MLVNVRVCARGASVSDIREFSSHTLFFVIFLILGRVGVPYIFLGHKDTNTLLS